MVVELLVALVVEAVDGCFLDGPVRPFDLPVCPRALGLVRRWSISSWR